MSEDRVEPNVRDALIGAAIGLLILYGGTLIQGRFLRWLTLGIGVVWVAVMTAFIGGVVATSLRRKLAPLTRKLRGHVIIDPELGPLHRDVRARGWRAQPIARQPEIEFEVEGDDQPDPRLLVRAREAAAGFDAIERRVGAFVVDEAATESADQELAAEIRALRIASLSFLIKDAPRTFRIELKGPDEDRYWSCVYDDSGPRDLDFD
jgi:hypothetical protein